MKGQFWSNPNYLDQSKYFDPGLNLFWTWINQKKKPLKLYVSSIANYFLVSHTNWYKIHAFFICLFRSAVARVDINCWYQLNLTLGDVRNVWWSVRDESSLLYLTIWQCLYLCFFSMTGKSGGKVAPKITCDPLV